MLKEVIDVLEEHKISYYLIAGTLLGAVRHNGFIPWDDDLDIGLPRPDYEKFLKNKEKWLPKRYKVDNFRSNPNYKYYITRVYDTEFRVKELRGKQPQLSYASLDIFPLDGTPNNKIFRYIFLKKIMFYRMLSALSNYDNIDQNRKRNFFEKLCIVTFGFLKPEKWLNRNQIYKKIDQILKTQTFEKSDYVGAVMGAYREKEIFSKKFIGEPKKYTFEHFRAYGPQDYDGYLKHMYDDYMKIPSSTQIIEKKHFEILEREK